MAQQAAITDTLSCNPESTAYKARYEKLNDLYVKMLTSQASIDYTKKLNEYTAKYYTKEYYKLFVDGGSQKGFFKKWIIENLDKTKFKSLKEVDDESKVNSNLLKIVKEQNKELYYYIDDTNSICEDMIYKLNVELMIYFGNRFH